MCGCCVAPVAGLLLLLLPLAASLPSATSSGFQAAPLPLSPSAPAVADTPTVYTLTTPGCNSGGALSQLPAPHGDYFVGRLPISAATPGGTRDPPPGNFGCTMNGWQLGLLHMDDWSALTLSLVNTVLWPNAHDDRFPKTPVQGGKYVLDSAYDPTVAQFDDGNMWVSFECAGVGFFTSSCLGPLTGANGSWTLDLSRTVLAVTPPSADKAASVPKIFAFQGRQFLWFDYFLTDVGHIEARGVELVHDDGVYWAIGHGDTMPMDDPGAVAVWQPGGADSAIADVFGVEVSANGRHLFVTAGVGGPGCRAPDSPVDGCYRLAVGRTNFPLGAGLANEATLDGATALPGNAQEYAKEMTLPPSAAQQLGQQRRRRRPQRLRTQAAAPSPMPGDDDAPQKLLFAHFLDKRPGSPGYAIPAGFVGLVLPRADNPAFWALSSPCDPASQPYPDWSDRAMQCLPSCGGLGGTSSFNTPCAANGNKRDVGKAYDVPYCCAD